MYVRVILLQTALAISCFSFLYYTLCEAEASQSVEIFITTPWTRYICHNLSHSFNGLARDMRCSILFHVDYSATKLHWVPYISIQTTTLATYQRRC